MTSYLLISIGVLSLATLFAWFWHFTDSEREWSAELDNQAIKREIQDIEVNRPEYIVDWREES